MCHFIALQSDFKHVCRVGDRRRYDAGKYRASKIHSNIFSHLKIFVARSFQRIICAKLDRTVRGLTY